MPVTMHRFSVSPPIATPSKFADKQADGEFAFRKQVEKIKPPKNMGKQLMMAASAASTKNGRLEFVGIWKK